MSRSDFLAAADPVRDVKTFPDGETATAAAARVIVHGPLAQLAALHREAGRNLRLWSLLASTPPFCVALMLEGGVALACAGRAGLGARFAWAMAVLLGIALLTRTHIQAFARNPGAVALVVAARELRLLLVYLGSAWGLGAFLILPPTPAVWFFAAGPGLTATLILKDARSAIAFGAPAALLSASALARTGPEQALLAAVSIAVLSMLRRAILWREGPP